jgi:diguanylate cyclase (GGDEF)-like protein
VILAFPLAAVETGLPLHLRFDAEGRVTGTGPTFERVAPGATGRYLDEVVEIAVPRMDPDPGALLRVAGRKLAVRLLAERAVSDGARRLRMNAVAFPMADGTGVLNLSFGLDLAPAVRRYGLSARDFSPLDPAIDVLFLLEAQAVVHAEFQRLSDRLDGARRQALAQAETDTLTGLANRRALDRRMDELRAEARPFAVMLVDLDHFKAVNDGQGHAAGDHVLMQVARALLGQVRDTDTVARTGGDEFVLVFAGCDDLDPLERIARRIIDGIERPISWQGAACRVSCSIGIALSATFPEGTVDEIVAAADAALYEAKGAGRGRHAVARAADDPDRLATVPSMAERRRG